ncbi:MAG: hypothetical protein ACM3JB_01725 [Acidobacteriaceae bacterium]
MQIGKSRGHVLPVNPLILAGRSTEIDLFRELEELRNSPEWSSGIARKVLIRYPDLQITLRRMKAGTCIPDHHNPGRICVQTIFGHIRMHAEDKIFDLPQGKMLVLDRAVIHDVEALQESAFLLTVASAEPRGD